MISRFRHKGLERFFKASGHGGMPAQHLRSPFKGWKPQRGRFMSSGRKADANPKRSQAQADHPGAVLREDVLPALHMTQTEFARRLKVSRLTVSELLLEKRGLSAEIAVRIGQTA